MVTLLKSIPVKSIKPLLSDFYETRPSSVQTIQPTHTNPVTDRAYKVRTTKLPAGLCCCCPLAAGFCWWPSPNPRHRSQTGRQIQRMTGVSALRQPQVVQGGKHGAHHVVPAAVGAVNAPGCDHHAGLGGQLLKIGVVFRPDRVVLRQHVGRLRGAVGKEVGHAQRAMTPGSCERDAAPDGGVVGGLVSGARVQADEHRGRPFAPATPQRVAVASAGAQERIALHRFVPPTGPSNLTARTHPPARAPVPAPPASRRRSWT